MIVPATPIVSAVSYRIEKSEDPKGGLTTEKAGSNRYDLITDYQVWCAGVGVLLFTAAFGGVPTFAEGLGVGVVAGSGSCHQDYHGMSSFGFQATTEAP